MNLRGTDLHYCDTCKCYVTAPCRRCWLDPQWIVSITCMIGIALILLNPWG